MITSWNPAATRLYGYSAEEAVGQPISILIPSDHAGEERDILRMVLEGGRVEHYETERVRKDGSRVPVALTVSAITESDGSISGASVIARNISDQRRDADRAARQQQLTTELAKTVAPEEVVNAAVREAISALNADGGAVGLLEEDGETIRVAGYSGYSEASLANWETFSVKAALPMSEVVRTGKVAWVVGKEDIVNRYPALAGTEIKFLSRAIVPLWAHGRVFGAISLSFREARSFEPDERAFLEAIVQQAAYALDRAQLHAAEQRARQNLDFLARGQRAAGSVPGRRDDPRSAGRLRRSSPGRLVRRRPALRRRDQGGRGGARKPGEGRAGPRASAASPGRPRCAGWRSGRDSIGRVGAPSGAHRGAAGGGSAR